MENKYMNENTIIAEYLNNHNAEKIIVFFKNGSMFVELIDSEKDIFSEENSQLKNILNNSKNEIKSMVISTSEDKEILYKEMNGFLEIGEENNEESKEQKHEEMIDNILRDLDIYAHLKGYKYIKDAVMFALLDANKLDSFTKLLYPEIAKKNKTATSSVEKAIRHAITVFWKNNGIEKFNNIFNYSNRRKKPTSSELITLIVAYINNENKKTLK